MGNSFYNDDDVKIAPNDLSKLFEKENPVADDNIELYLKQRSLGNTAKARKLGKEYVSDMLDCVWTKAPEEIDQALFDTQVKILFAYAVHRIIEDYSDNHIVANTAIGSFHEQLEQEDPGLFDALCDQTGFFFGAWPLETAILKAFIKQNKTISFPIESFDPVTFMSAE